MWRAESEGKRGDGGSGACGAEFVAREREGGRWCVEEDESAEGAEEVEETGGEKRVERAGGAFDAEEVALGVGALESAARC